MSVLVYDKLTVTLPEGFRSADENEKKACFGTTPVDHAFLDESKGATIGILRTGTELTDDKVGEQIAAYRQHYSRMVPGYDPGEMRKSRKTGRNVAFISYKANAPTRYLYSILAITTLEDKEIVLLFSCDMRDAMHYMYRFLKVLDTLEFAQ